MHLGQLLCIYSDSSLNSLLPPCHQTFSGTGKQNPAFLYSYTGPKDWTCSVILGKPLSQFCLVFFLPSVIVHSLSCFGAGLLGMLCIQCVRNALWWLGSSKNQLWKIWLHSPLSSLSSGCGETKQNKTNQTKQHNNKTHHQEKPLTTQSCYVHMVVTVT